MRLLVCAALFIFGWACQPLADFPTPHGFIKVDTDRHAYHAVTPEDAGLTCNIHESREDEPSAELAFISRVAERRIKEDLGYDSVVRKDVNWGSVAGTKFTAAASKGGQRYFYSQWSFVTIHDVYSWQYAGPEEFAEADLEAIEASFASSKP